MISNFAALLDGPVYGTFGVSAILVTSASAVHTVTAIDNSRGAEIKGRTGSGRGADGISIGTMRPVADVRATELAGKGIDPASLDDGTITLNGATWLIKSHIPKPGPAGELTGEVRLMLSDEPSS